MKTIKISPDSWHYRFINWGFTGSLRYTEDMNTCKYLLMFVRTTMLVMIYFLGICAVAVLITVIGLDPKDPSDHNFISLVYSFVRGIARIICFFLLLGALNIFFRYADLLFKCMLPKSMPKLKPSGTFFEITKTRWNKTCAKIEFE